MRAVVRSSKRDDRLGPSRRTIPAVAKRLLMNTAWQSGSSAHIALGRVKCRVGTFRHSHLDLQHILPYPPRDRRLALRRLQARLGPK